MRVCLCVNECVYNLQIYKSQKLIQNFKQYSMSQQNESVDPMPHSQFFSLL